jgi:threonine/homoserine efflux transporter RhtA
MPSLPQQCCAIQEELSRSCCCDADTVSLQKLPVRALSSGVHVVTPCQQAWMVQSMGCACALSAGRCLVHVLHGLRAPSMFMAGCSGTQHMTEKMIDAPMFGVIMCLQVMGNLFRCMLAIIAAAVPCLATVCYNKDRRATQLCLGRGFGHYVYAFLLAALCLKKVACELSAAAVKHACTK